MMYRETEQSYGQYYCPIANTEYRTENTRITARYGEGRKWWIGGDTGARVRGLWCCGGNCVHQDHKYWHNS